MSSKPVYYIDSCIFLTLLKNEKTIPGILGAVKKTFEEFDKNQCIFLLSTLIKIEVLPHDSRSEKDEVFLNYLKRKNIQLVDVNSKVTDKARELCIHYNNNDNRSNLKAPDAIHLATAILYKADVFYTSDGYSKDKNHKKLLQMSEDQAINGLKIICPCDAQTDMFEDLS